MLSNLASYLGYSAPAAKAPEVEKAPAEMWLRAVEEDEWVLVEKNEKEAAAAAAAAASVHKNEVDEDTEMTRVTLAASTHPSSLPSSSKTLSRSASFDVLNPLQESWYLTPPPSFTSEGPVHMETSPLENLLIEHPSMSVYERTAQRTEASRKMSNSSPSSGAAPEEEHPPVALLPIKERMYKLPRNKVNPKVSKKQPSSPSSSIISAAVSLEMEERLETKETKMKNFVKSPRRSINSELQSLPKKALRKRQENLSGPREMISKSTGKQDVISEEESAAIPNIPPRRLYSEVLASKPETPAVQTSSQVSNTFTKKEEELKANVETKPETATTTATTPTPVETTPTTSSDSPAETPATTMSEETVMSVEENVEDGSERLEDRDDRRKVVQAQPDRQHRLHFLNRSAQKVEQRKTCDVMKKNPLIRTNKAREFNFRNKRQRRADMMQRHSGANNNRKCAKTTLY